jgi:predicted negative regulator of RcsB-dependent stress response
MLMALHEQAASQMATAEKLRNMEGTLVELQARAAQFAQRVEQEGTSQSLPVQGSPTAAETTRPDSLPVSVAKPQANVVAAVVDEDDTPWSLYGLVLGMVLGVGGWLGWRKYREAKAEGSERDLDEGVSIAIPELRVDPKRMDEREEPDGAVDLHFEQAPEGAHAHIDLDLDLGGKAVGDAQADEHHVEKVLARGPDSVLSISATTLDEHFEANPVMELADIMLSFGRVKGAAQALQEFIDHNPEEALQPWIRLMDVYRMAGMRMEFETVARNLNQHFNVEVQSWDAVNLETSAESLESNDTTQDASRPPSLEDMPRLMNTVLAMWAEGDVVGYLYQLLRDNRGGQRQGFALPVVEDILFLIELKETANRME